MRIPRNATGWGKGFAFVTLESAQRLHAALSLDDTPFQGRRLVVKLSKRPSGMLLDNKYLLTHSRSLLASLLACADLHVAYPSMRYRLCG